MSHTERRRQQKQVKTLCVACRERKARFRYRGEVRADRDHTLCFECYRGEVNRARARRLGGLALDRRQITHRQHHVVRFGPHLQVNLDVARRGR